jgi:hypothetical protein
MKRAVAADRFRRIALIIGLVLIQGGCGGESGAGSAPTPGPTPIPLEPQTLGLGVLSDGTPFWEWEGVTRHEFSFKGLVHWGGCHALAAFRTEDGQPLVDLDLRVVVTEEDVYRVEGTYRAGVPFTLTLLGTAPSPEDDVMLEKEAGEGDIRHTGTAPFTYKPRQ